MKRIIKNGLVLATLTGLVLAITGCATQKSGGGKEKELTVGVCAGPYGDLFSEAITPSLEAKGYQVKLVEYSDYVQPNLSLADGEIDLNVFQHTTYLKNFSEERGLDLTYITEIPTAGMGIFSDKVTSIEELGEGAVVAIPNDVTNLSRAIRVLEQSGLVKIDENTDPSAATQYTLSENAKALSFVEIEAPQLPRSLDSTDVAIINGNFALSAGLDLSTALYSEEILEGYLNCIAVRSEDAEAQFVKDIVEIVHSEAFKKVIEDTTKPYHTFQRPSDY